MIDVPVTFLEDDKICEGKINVTGKKDELKFNSR